MRLGIVITDGVGYRNFILSDFPNVVLGRFESVVIYSCIPSSAYPRNLADKLTIVELEVYKEYFLTGFLRKIKELAHLIRHAHGNFGIADNLKANCHSRFTRSSIRTRISVLLARLFHTEKNIIYWTKLQMFSLQNHPVTIRYQELIEHYRNDVLFFTHQRPPFAAPMIQAAKQKKVKTAAFIFSWDNIASKGRMAGNFDHYIVWSDLMKQELQHFYTSIQTNHIHVGGTPQFEPYVMDRYKMTRADFCAGFMLDTDKPTICFSCGDISTSKNDELYITEIAKAIVNNELIKEVNFLVRTSPAEEPKRFFSLAEQFSLIKWNYPKWTYAREGHPEPWTQRIPLEQDVRDLKAILEYCDVSINMCSTMSLDFMQFDKPVINPVFGDNQNGLYDDQRFLKYAHYENVVKSGAVEIVKNKKDLVFAINEAIENPGKKSNQRKQLLKLQIGRPLYGTSENIIQILGNIGSK